MTTRSPLILDDAPMHQRQATMGGRVLDALRRAIVRLQLRPGDLLSEAEVARQLGVSRQPVREAFIKLAEIGLVEIRPQRGTFVKLISLRDVENARFIREAIEVAIARKAAREAPADQVAALADLVARQREASAAGDHVGFLGLDENFHQTLAHAADCAYAWHVLENLKVQMDRARYLSMPDASPIDTLIGQHADLVDALSRRAPDDAEAAMHAHLGEMLVSLPRIATAHPDLFTD